MLPRFFAPDLDPSSSFVTLPAEEARHLARVLRLSAGDDVTVFDGRGVECRGVVEVAVRDTVTVRLLEGITPPDAPAVAIVVVQAVLKGSSMDDAIRDATMMGAESIVPVLSAHCDVKTSFARRPETVERWRRVALASVKQSRRATLPAVEDVKALADWLAAPSVEMKLLFVEPSAGGDARAVKGVLERAVPTRLAVLLGPEGGWAAEEVSAALAAGCEPVSLGPLTLRAESMPVAALAAIQAVAR